MKKRTKLLFVLAGVIIIVASLCYLTKSRPLNVEYTNEFVATRLISKSVSYPWYKDSAQKETFIKSYGACVEKIKDLKGRICCIGERIGVAKSQYAIDMMVVSAMEDGSFVRSYINYLNGRISVYAQKSRYRSPDLSIHCDLHYFYLPTDARYPYDSYSLVVIENRELRDIKVFFSDKYDPFINVVSPCDTLEIKALVGFTETAFNRRELK